MFLEYECGKNIKEFPNYKSSVVWMNKNVFETIQNIEEYELSWTKNSIEYSRI